MFTDDRIEGRPDNSRFAKAGVSCFYDSEVLNSSFVRLIKFSAKNPHLRKAAKRYANIRPKKETKVKIFKNLEIEGNANTQMAHLQNSTSQRRKMFSETAIICQR